MNLEEQIKNLVIAASSVDLKQRFAEWSTTIKDEIFLINDDIKEAESEFKELKGYSDTKIDDFENCFENYYAAKKRLKKHKQI